MNGVVRWLGVGVGMTIGASPALATWPHAGHDQDATHRAEGAGALRRAPGHEPGFREIVDVRRRALGPGRLWDVDRNGRPEFLSAQHGSIVALDLGDGTIRWRSPPRGIDQIAAIGDFDGDGHPELVATASGVRGGLYVVDLVTGALLGGLTELPERSGIEATELAIADLDDDGIDEIVAPAGLFGLGQVWVLDFETGLDAPDVTTLQFDGYANTTPVRVGRFAPGGSWGMVIDQGPDQRIVLPCPSRRWCVGPVFHGTHPDFAFGRTHVLDLDGDELDEIFTVASTPRFSRGISMLDVADGLAGGFDLSLVRWAWRYDATVPTTQLQTPAQPPIDLDGDGRVELVVSVVNDLDQDVDAFGVPVSDGIDRAGAISTLVLDGPTGTVKHVLDDVFAYGWADLDGNGRPELIVSPTLEWTYRPRLVGIEFGCTSGCPRPQWEADDARLHRHLDAFAGTALPPAVLPRVDPGPSRDALVVYRGSDQLGRLAGSEGSVSIDRTVTVTESALLHHVTDEWIVVAYRDTAQLLDASLTPIAPPVALPPQGSAQWRAAPLREGGPTILAFEGHLRLDQSRELSLLPQVALIADLNGDARSEIVHYRTSRDGLGPGFELRIDHVVGDQLEARWSRTSHQDPALDGYVPAGPLHVQTGHFNDHGSRDLVVPARRGSTWRYLVFDGDTGDLEATLSPGTGPSTYSPALIADLYLNDGIDEIVVHGSSRLAVLAIGAEGPLWTTEPGFYHSVGLNADLDGDSTREMVGTLSATLENRIEAHRPGTTIDQAWGPHPLGRPSGHANVLAVGHFDGQPGLDPVYIDGDGGLAIYAGVGGQPLFEPPLYMAGGQLVHAPPPDTALARAVLVFDADGDGAEEVIVGTADGRVYAINAAALDPQRGTLEWSIDVGAAVVQLAAADADNDGALELLVANDRGQGLVIDDLGVQITLDPVDDCITPGPVLISGQTRGLARVEIWLNGTPTGAPTPSSDDRWAVRLALPRPGEYQLEVRGLDDRDMLRRLTTATIVVQPTCPHEPDPSFPSDDGEPDRGRLVDRGCRCRVDDGPPGFGLFALGLLALGLGRQRQT